MDDEHTDKFRRSSSPEQPVSSLTLQNPQITAALLNSPMQQDHFGPPGQQMGQQPNGGGPIRVQTMPQMRPMPYALTPQQQQQQQQQMRQMPPPPQNNPHYSPMGMNPQNQYAGNGQIQIAQHPQMPQQQPPQMQMQHNFGPSMGMPQQVQQMQMGMPVQQPMMVQQQNQQQQNPQAFAPANSPLPPPAQPASVPAVPATSSSSVASQPAPVMAALTVGAIMDKARLDDLMAQINKNTVLEEGVKDALVEYADDFVTSVIDKACKLIKHRGSRKIEARDIEFVLENVYNMPTVPRAAVHIFGAPDSVNLRREKNIPTEAHKQRLALLKKQLKKI